MRKALLFVLILSVPAWALKDVSVGAFGGLNIPIVQDDAASGSDFGIKAKFSPIPMLAGVAFFEARTMGDAKFTFNNTEYATDAGSVTSFGVEALIGSTGGGTGPHFYFAVGLSNYKWTRDNWEDFNKVGYHFGPGFEVVFPAKIGLEFRGYLEIVPTEDASRKNGILLVGGNYHFGLM